MADGGGEGTRAVTYESAQKRERDITKDAIGRAGQVGQEGVPWRRNGNIEGCRGHQTGERNPDLVDRTEPTVRDHSAGMMDREATVVRLERVVLLEES